MPDEPVVDPEDQLDGCELDFKAHADDQATQDMRALFPGDTQTTREDWVEVFGEPDAS